MMSKAVVIDFDGTIMEYEGYKDGSLYGEPIEGSFNFILTLIQKRYTVYILTARPNHYDIPKWLEDKDFPKEAISKVKVTNKKPPAALYIDDRGYRFTTYEQAVQDVPKILEDESLFLKETSLFDTL